MRGWTKAEMGLAAADPLSGKWVVDLRAARYDYRSLSYYGAGPDSSKEGRSNYRLEDTAFDASAGWRFRKGLLAGLSAGYERARTGEGEDSRYAQAGRLYAGDARPFGEAMGFTRTGAFFQADQRDNPAGARRGGLYTARFDDYRAGAGQPYSFQRLDLEAQHYQPLFNQRRVIALRARTIQSFTSGGNRVPFFHQAVLGGSDDLRGFRPYRFQDDNLLVVNAEYRWEVFSGLDMAVFGDAGRVSARRWDFSPRDLETSAGFGLRFNARNATFLRVDVGFSHEGFQVFVKFNQVYRERRLGTSTAPHLY
jgi:outer membrane protein assembly factor BamA